MDQQSTNERCDTSKQSSFHATYQLLCRDKNVPAILELIKSKSKLEFVADRMKIDQCEMICKSLEQDNTLEFLAIRSRKSSGLVNDQFNSDKRLDIITPLIRAVAGCLKRSFVITKLALEGLPLTVDNIRTTATAISRNSSLKTLSFARSHIMDEGCNIICCTVRELPHIEKLNLSQCYLTATAAFYISELIKFQTINRNSEGWMKSLRYRDVDVDSVPGLKCLILNGNQFRDDGLELITSKLKEDMWMKAIEVQNCELTDVGGEAILDCLNFNKTLIVFDASRNYKICNKIHKKIQMILCSEPDNYDSMPKITNSELRERMEFLEQQLQLETFNRERADDLNVQLHQNLVRCDVEIAEKSYEPPSGYQIVQSDELNALYKEIEDLVQEASHSRDVKREKEIIKTEKGANTGHSGFGDTLESSERKTYASFIPFCHEAKTVELTPYSQESNTSKLDDDVTTVNSDDEEFGDSKQESVFERHIEFGKKIFGDGKYEMVDCDSLNTEN